MLKNGIKHLKLGNTMPFLAYKPRNCAADLLRNCLENASVTITENANKVRAAFIDFRQTNRQNLAVNLILLGNSPTKVNTEEGYTSLSANSI